MSHPEVKRNQRLNQFSNNSPANLHGSKILVALGSGAISGGTNFILNYAHSLSSAGANVTIGLFAGQESDLNWHPMGRKCKVSKLNHLMNSYFDLGICTYWRTVRPMLDVKCSKYLYFVQALETRFGLNEGNLESAIRAAYTYQIGMPTITNASWMQNLITLHSTSKTWLVRPGIDKFLFKKTNLRESNEFTVLIEGNYSVEAKQVPQALAACSRAGISRILYASPTPHRKSRKFEVHSEVPFTKMPTLYNKADVILKLSLSEGAFGPPIEAFHCGATAIVSRVTGFDEYIIDRFNALVVDLGDIEGASNALLELKDDRSLLQSLKDGATSSASIWPSIEESGHLFSKICSLVLNSSFTNIDRIMAIKQLDHALDHHKRKPDKISWAIM